MFTWMRTHQRTLMLVITVLTIIAFAFLYSYTDDPRGRSNNQVGRIYDKNISHTTLERNMRKFQLAIGLGLTDYASQLGNGGEEGAVEFAINSMIIEHEGRKLGIHPNDAEVTTAITALPVFQTGGQFDPNKYETMFQLAFAPQGFNKTEIDELVRSSLVFDRLKTIIESAPSVTDMEVIRYGRAFQPVSGMAVVFDRNELAKNITITNEQIAEYFKGHATQFVTPEWRTVRFVRFPLPADAKKLEGKAKIDAQQKVANASDAFAQRAAEEGFEKAAKAAGLKIENTLPFDRNGNIQSLSDLKTNPTIIAPTLALAPAAFTLTETSPLSGVIESGNEFFVVDLTKVIKSRPMTLEEARPTIVQQLTQTATQVALEKAGETTTTNLRAAIKNGDSFAKATIAAKLKTQPFSNISLADQAASPDQRKYVDATMMLEENEVSRFKGDGGGGYLVWLEKRAPMDPKKFDARRKEVEASILGQRQTLLFRDWLNHAQKESGAQLFGADRG